MYSPKLNETEQTRDNIEVFGGYNGNVRIAENEFSAMYNMSSVNYPALSPRPRRGRWNQIDNCQGVISKTEIGCVENDVLKYGAYEMPLNPDCAGKERQLVSMGAKIIVYPDFMYFNTANPDDCGNMYNEEKAFTASNFILCNADGTEYSQSEIHIDGYSNDGTFIPKNGATYYIDPFEEVQYLQGLSAENNSTTATLICKGWGIQNGKPIIKLEANSDGVYITTTSTFDEDQFRVELNSQRPIFGVIEYEGVELNIVGVTSSAPDTTEDWTFKPNLNPIVVGDKRIVYEGGESKLQECVSVLPNDTWKSSECWRDVESYVKVKHSSSLKEYAEKIVESKASDRIVFDTDNTYFKSLAKRYADKSPYIFRQQYAKAYENDSILVRGCLDRTVSSRATAVTIKFVPKKPVLDYIIESGNRLWGCRYGQNEAGEYVNEIYATARGSFEWEIFEGTADDSYAVSLGTDGDFTGAVNYKGVPIFFKENSYSAVYGAYPQSYTVDTEIGRGVQAGAYKTLCVIDNVLYYKSEDGIYRYDGASHDKISEALGNKEYKGDCAGSIDGKYYISMTAENSISEVFVYDIRKDMWHKEDTASVQYFVAHKGELYAIYDSLVSGSTETRFWAIKGTKGTLEDSLPWSVDSGVIGYSMVDAKYVDKLQMRMMLPCGSRVSFYIEYDSDGYFESIGSIDGKSFSAFTLPITPRRCDHFKLRIKGEGECKIFSLSKVMELGGDL